MSEFMSNTIDSDPMEVITKVYESPIKATGEVTMSSENLEVQAAYLRGSMVEIDYDTVRGTCGDERYRVGLRTGEEIVEARPSVFGGHNIYGLYVSELASMFAGSEASPNESLDQVTRDLNRNKVASGGHEHCAAAAGFGVVLANIVENADLVRAYTQANKSDYDADLTNEVLENAARIVTSKKYEGWDGESALIEVLGDEAGEAIERLADVPHTGRTLARNKRSGVTIDQTQVHQNSDGEDSFEWDDPYADRIENAAAAGPDAARIKRVMEHAREAVLVGVALAVPNPELHQIDVQ